MTPRNITLILGIAAFGALFSYIILAGNITAIGYTLEEKKQKLVDLEEIEGRYVVELAHVQNPTSLHERSAFLHLIEIGNTPRYLDTRATNLGLVGGQQNN